MAVHRDRDAAARDGAWLNRARRRTKILSWVASILVALIFLSEGAAKFPESRLWLRVFDQIGFGQWFRSFTGVVEIAGALLLIVPATRLVARPCWRARCAARYSCTC